METLGELVGFDLFTKFDEDMIVIEKWNPKKPVTAIYFDGEKEQYNVKRFLVEPTDKKVLFITEHEKSFLEIVSTDWLPQIQLNFAKIKGTEKDSEILNLEQFIAIKGLKAIGNRLTTNKIKNIDLLEPLPFEEVQEPIIDNQESNDELILNDNISDFSPEEKILESSSSTDNEKELTTILPKQKAKPIKDVLDDDEENQMTLF